MCEQPNPNPRTAIGSGNEDPYDKRIGLALITSQPLKSYVARRSLALVFIRVYDSPTEIGTPIGADEVARVRIEAAVVLGAIAVPSG